MYIISKLYFASITNEMKKILNLNILTACLIDNIAQQLVDEIHRNPKFDEKKEMNSNRPLMEK